MQPMTSTLFEYDHYLDGGLFRDAVFPDNIDRQLVIDTIIINCGEYEPLYKNADFMQEATRVWSEKWQHAFERWALALSEDYNPLHNYDRYEEIHEEHDNESSNKVDASTSTDDVNTNTRSAYNSDDYEPHDQSSLKGSGTSKSDGTGTDKGKFDRSAHLYGNIGVTTSAQMLEGELEVRKNNLYNMIAECYAAELCLLVY